MTELTQLTAVEARRLIGIKDISPVELLEACLARIDAINGGVNAICATDRARARKDAKAIEDAARKGEALGALAGLPAGIKDLDEVQGLLTTFGSPQFRAHVPAADNSMVARLRAAGAVIVAKTNTPEFGAGANTRNPVWGATGNPFDPAKNAGGSSGGSAVALATDMLPVCTGSDTGGSLRIPAAYCGIVGFRPSPGLVPAARHALGWSSISVLGPMGKTVADTGLLLSVQAGLDPVDPLSYEVNAKSFARLRPLDLGRLRVAVTEDFGVCPVDNDYRAVFRAKVAAMRHLFRECATVDFDFAGAHRAFDVLRAQGFIAKHAETYAKNPDILGPNVRANYELGAKMTLGDMAWAHAEQTRIYRAFQDKLHDYDLVIAPTVPISPFPWTEFHLAAINGEKLANYYHWLALTYVVSLVGNASMALPCGRDQHDMPFGLQIIGRHRADRMVLEAGHALETAFARDPALARPRPDVAKLKVPRPELKSIVTAPPAL